jgi:hypothetical protein
MAQEKEKCMLDNIEIFFTQCAFEGFPIYLLNGEVRFSQGRFRVLPTPRMLNQGWGVSNFFLLGENNISPMPEGCYLEWYSVFEDHFYSVEFSLLDSKFVEFWSEGFLSPESHTKGNYSTFIIGIAPAGLITIWCSGEGVTKRFISVQAQMKQIKWEAMQKLFNCEKDEFRLKCINQYVTKESQNNNKQIVNLKRFIDRWNSTWLYKLRILLPAYFISIWIEFINGERHYYEFDEVILSNGGLISKLIVKWQHYDNQLYLTEVELNSDEFLMMLEYMRKSETLFELHVIPINFNAEFYATSNKEYYKFETIKTKTLLYD